MIALGPVTEPAELPVIELRKLAPGDLFQLASSGQGAKIIATVQGPGPEGGVVITYETWRHRKDSDSPHRWFRREEWSGRVRVRVLRQGHTPLA